MIPIVQLTIDRATLEELLQHAAFAAHLIGHLDDKAQAELIRQLGDRVDTIAQQPKAPVLLTHTSATSLVRHEDEVISRLRRRLAEKLKQPVDHPFFEDRYLPGEEPRAALLRMFKLLQWSVSLTDEQTIESMAKDE